MCVHLARDRILSFLSLPQGTLPHRPPPFFLCSGSPEPSFYFKLCGTGCDPGSDGSELGVGVDDARDAAAGAATSTYYYILFSRVFRSSTRFHARRGVCYTSCPCLLDADWCLQSHGVSELGHQGCACSRARCLERTASHEAACESRGTDGPGGTTKDPPPTPTPPTPTPPTPTPLAQRLAPSAMAPPRRRPG